MGPVRKLTTGLSAVIISAVVVALMEICRIETSTLTPPYFNLAEGKNISASSTCGVGIETPRELYCKLVGANTDNEHNIKLIQGQVCDYCDPNNPSKMHPPEFAVDGLETWWQSPPLSRGKNYNEVNLTINLGQEFHVAYVYIRMGNSPRPGVWVLEKSSDYDKTYTPWQYFADNANDCEMFFGSDSLKPITKDDSVICTSEFSKVVPLEGGEIPISLLNNRPSAKTYFNSSVLQEWTRATNVRLRFLRTKNLLGHLMSVIREDPTVTRRYFYSIKDISIGGRCMCNGHADTCDIQDSANPTKLKCRCQHNTCGSECTSCCSGYEQKAWRIAKSWEPPFVCEPCNCFGHSSTCEYSKKVDDMKLSLDIHGNYDGGGVCKNCQHNTDGINCHKCKPKYYRPYGKQPNETDACQECSCNAFYATGNCAEGTGQCECRPEFKSPSCDSCNVGFFDYPTCRPCECNLNGTRGYYCEPVNGQCPCKSNFGGRFCKECALDHYGFPECIQCACDPYGSISSHCDSTTGVCPCLINFGERTCSQCADGFYSYPSCFSCDCNIEGTTGTVCDKDSGKCICREGYAGEKCDRCERTHYGYPNCVPCNCTLTGALSPYCENSGKCDCFNNYAGRACDSCAVGFYNYPECLECECQSQGSKGISCDDLGTCQCHNNFVGKKCSECREGFYNFPNCEECNCNPAGVVEAFGGCGSVPVGELCKCKERVEGRICNRCKPLYWDLNFNNVDGCRDCNCHLGGVIGNIGVCDVDSGQCMCKPFVQTQKCTECVDGTYQLIEDNMFGCTECECDIGGALDQMCNKYTGQCACQPRVQGLRCNEPIAAHYFPTLHHMKFELEDAQSASQTQVRSHFNESVFPGYSWKGYAVFSPLLQTEIVYGIHVPKSSLYRMIFRYVNPNRNPVEGLIIIKSLDHVDEQEQKVRVYFKAPLDTETKAEPAYMAVSNINGIESAFVLNPGKYDITIKIDQHFMLDYFVLLPAAYYEATVLSKNVISPCKINSHGLCRYYVFPNMTLFDRASAESGFITDSNEKKKLTEFFYDEQRDLIIPRINENQTEIHLDLNVTMSGPHVMILNYVSPNPIERTEDIQKIVIEVRSDNSPYQNGIMTLYNCPYIEPCRQVVVDDLNRVKIFNFNTATVNVVLKGITNAINLAIHSIIAIPHSDWSLDFIRPSSVCVLISGKCAPANLLMPPDSKQIQLEKGNENRSITLNSVFYDNANSLVYLNGDNPRVSIASKVLNAGNYVIIVQYYQPDHKQFSIDVIVENGNRRKYEAKLDFRHCPSYSGCRAVLKQLDGSQRFDLENDFDIRFESREHPNKLGVWLDYVLVVPEDHYSSKYLVEQNYDETGRFISECAGNNHFFNMSVEETAENAFCREAVFSMTVDFNGGALPCNCDYLGSLSFQCARFGGQCECKPNVIGRKCETCKSGYYGFPDCKPCNCPSSASCEPTSGACICPSRVVGDRCDKCMPLTYGFDPFNGCEECNCNYHGVVDSNLQCDLLNGSCTCKNNIVGRTCSQCQPGHYAFPYCQRCDCDERGTTETICDQTTARCLCKQSVVGHRCDSCEEGTFDLQASNERGCIRCFCFGRTTRCHSSSLYRQSHMNMTKDAEWYVVAISESDQTELSIQELGDELQIKRISDSTLGIDLSDFIKKGSGAQVIYLAAPDSYLGNRLGSYGGFLNYTIFYTTGPQGKAILKPEVILYGANFYLLHNAVEQPPSNTEFYGSVRLDETSFVFPNRLPVNREHVMLVLNNLSGLFVRVTYWESSVTTRLGEVTLSIATESLENAHGAATAVEHCQCPPNYSGLSCEDCAPGYYRSKTGPHGGFCVPCQCNGHADECDVDTGICINCKHNTMGYHCETCSVGYHGNATQGTPSDCLICACPLPLESNNFATSCNLGSDGSLTSCDCMNGYLGDLCETCAAGFYGRPEVEKDFCKSCDCSGNIDRTDAAACDHITGDCLRCLNNSYGRQCEICAPGFYGDAVIKKNCEPCVCDEHGTESCDNQSGVCKCKEGVIGEKCDFCAENHYGLGRGVGCSPCECSEASLSRSCDLASGQCRCQDGVEGRTCNKCIAGYWNLTASGCLSCGCKHEYSRGFGCNPLTGQCECLPDVIGEKCDKCPPRWVFVEMQGCLPCDSCVHDLVDIADRIQERIGPVIDEFNNTGSSFFTTRKLIYLKDRIGGLRSKVNAESPQSLNLIDRSNELQSLEHDSHQLLRKTNYSMEKANNLPLRFETVYNNIILQYMDTKDAGVLVQNAVDDIEKLANADLAQGSKLDVSLAHAESILKEIQTFDFDPIEIKASKALQSAEEVNQTMNYTKKPIEKRWNMIDEFRTKMEDFEKRVNDFGNLIPRIRNKTLLTEKLVRGRALVDKLKAKLANYNSLKDNTNTILLETHMNIKNATDNIHKILATLERIENDQKMFEMNVTRVNDTMIANNLQLDEMSAEIAKVNGHAENLTAQAKNVENLFRDTRYSSESAIGAANAYRDIAVGLVASKESVEAADAVGRNLDEKLAGINGKASESFTKSTELLDAIHKQVDSAAQIRARLNDIDRDIRDIQSKQNATNDGFDKIKRSIGGKTTDLDVETVLNSANKKAEDADDNSKAALVHLDPLVDEIPKKLTIALEIPKNVDETNKDIAQIRNQVNQYALNVPNLKSVVDEVEPEQKSMSDKLRHVGDKIDDLNKQIEMARNLADRIDVGVRFYPSTALQLRNPRNLVDQAVSSRASVFFKTANPNNFLFYIGNEIGTNLKKTKTDDFMALETENGYPILRIDLGNGPEYIFNNKYVADDKWYQAIVERTGPNVKLIIREEDRDHNEVDHAVEKILPGPNSILNLDETQSKIFVGGYPATFHMQPSVKYSSMEGSVEGFALGDRPLSLWNFVRGEDNNQGSMRRDKLKMLRRMTGYRFNGDGYAVLDNRPYSLKLRTNVKLSFKTVSPHGLLFLIGNLDANNFMSIELRDGAIAFQYKLENLVTLMATNKPYYDGEWHTVEIVRDGAKGVLYVDGELIFQDMDRGSQTVMELDPEMYFGGYPGLHKFSGVTNIDFSGCIDNVQIMSPVDLTDNIRAFGVSPGCPTEFSKLIAFSDENNGYLLTTNLSVSNQFQLNLKFKTSEANGLLFYATKGDQSDGISLSLKNSDLVLISQREKVISDRIAFNDNEWHVVSVTHSDAELKMVVDDYYYYTSSYSPPNMYMNFADLFIGGLPTVFDADPSMVASDANFIGCIGDATLNGGLINFANVTDRINGVLGNCSMERGETDDQPIDNSIDTLGTTVKSVTLTPIVFTSPPVDTIHITEKEPTKKIVTETKTSSTLSPPLSPTSTTLEPSPNESCSKVTFHEDKTTVRSYRFGVKSNSVMRFETPRGKHKHKFEFAFEFKTSDDGIIFYVSDQKHDNFIALFIASGIVYYMFDCGTGIANISTPVTFNDNNWHRVKIMRHHAEGKLVVDDGVPIEGQSSGTAKSMSVLPPFYLGGVPKVLGEIVKSKIGTDTPFFGCIRNFEMNNKPMMDPTAADVPTEVMPCSENVESGVYFDTPDSRFVVLRERFRVGHSINIKVDIKPRNNTGVILSISRGSEYLHLELDDGVVLFTVNNGRGSVVATFKPPTPFFFCDGKWHNVQAVKVKSFVTLSVDSVYSNSEIGRKHSSNIRGTMYLGGRPDIGDAVGLTTRWPYHGCIRNVVIDERSERIEVERAFGNVFVGVCPL